MALPVITFTVDNADIDLGDSITLSWSIENADSAVLNGDTGVDPTGSVEVTPESTSCYTLKAENSEGQSVEFVIVTVNIPQTQIPVFSTGWYVTWNGNPPSAVRCKNGENFPIELNVKDSSGNAMDLSEYSARYALKRRPSNLTTDYVIEPVEFSVENGNVYGNISASVTAEITPGNYFEEIELYTSDGEYVKKFSRQRIVEPSIIVSSFSDEDDDGETPPPAM